MGNYEVRGDVPAYNRFHFSSFIKKVNKMKNLATRKRYFKSLHIPQPFADSYEDSAISQ